MGYSKVVIKNAWDILDSRRKSSKMELEQRREKIYSHVPKIRDIEAKMSYAASQITKGIISSPKEAEALIKQLAKEIARLTAEREMLLVTNGYPLDYLTEKHVCSICGDSGYVQTEKCKCLEKLIKIEAFAHLNSATPADQSSFLDFELSYYPDTPVDDSGVIPQKRMGEVLEFCKKYADTFTLNSESILMVGKTGLGKTHLSLAIAKAVTENGYGVVYSPAQKLMDKFEAEKFSRSYDEEAAKGDTVKGALECDLLVLDDLGTEFITSFTISALYNIVNTRLVESRPTIINTNLDLKQVEEKYSSRMVSRLACGYRVLKFYGKDIRFMRKMQGRQVGY